MPRRPAPPLSHATNNRTQSAGRAASWAQVIIWMLGLSLFALGGKVTPSVAQTIPVATVTPIPTATDPLPSGTETPLPFTAVPTATAPIILPTPTNPQPEATATALPLAPPTPTATVPPVAQATATEQPNMLLSEFLADPKAVSDEAGEWLELYNAGATAVNLRGWTLADLDNDRHMIGVDLIIEAGQYLVLARNGDSASNGGIQVSYVYNNLSLANSNDELLLFTPTGGEVDRVSWGEGATLVNQSGASLQRTTMTSPGSWTASTTTWLGSAGDQGSPGSGYTAREGMPTPAASSTPGATATPAAQWAIASAPGILQIEEVYYSGSDDEFVALLNTGTVPLDLAGWVIGDEETPGEGEGMYGLPAGYLLAPGALFVVARDPTAFQTRWGSSPHAAFAGDNPALRLERRRELATGEWALNNSGDEVMLLSPSGELVDAVAFAGGNYAAVGLTGVLKSPQSDSLQQVPGPQFPTEREVRHRFLYAPPAPFTVVGLPSAQLSAPVALADQLVGIWGSLGAQSNFSSAGSAPPHYLLAAGAAQGLQFLAIADPTVTWPWTAQSPTILLPAWRWADSEGAKAILYGSNQEQFSDQNALLTFLARGGQPGAWLDKTPPGAALAAFNADSVTAPGDLPALYKSWAAAGAPQLPAGNAQPTLPGARNPTPRYTGLAVATVDQAALLAALSAHRGWLTSAPGLWLTLQVESSGARQWMGTTLAPANEVTIEIVYGDQQGDLAGLALWQNNVPIRQLDVGVGNHTWRLTVPALPDTFLFAVATQADGDFAVTSPIQVATATGGQVILNEVLPAAWDDHNGDGEISTADEFIELYNPSPYPLSLVGWQLVDAAGDGVDGRRFTFKAGQFVNGYGWLRLFNADTYISLNNENEYVRLLNPAGEEIDRVSWAINPGRGASLSRIPDGGKWLEGDGTPGRANRLFTGERTYVGPTATPKVKQKLNEREDDYLTPTPVQLPPTYGQAGGPPGSIAQSKLAGLEAWVEFRGVVTAPPGLFNASIYLADPAPDPVNGPLAGIGINVYLRNGAYPVLKEGEWVRVRGQLRSFRGEMELWVRSVTDIWPLEQEVLLAPLPVQVADIGESLEGRLVTLWGEVSSWQGDSIFLVDPANPNAPAVQITVRSSTGWRRPYVNKGQRWQATGIVSQFARESPWNGGYRILVRGELDLVKIKGPR